MCVCRRRSEVKGEMRDASLKRYGTLLARGVVLTERRSQVSSVCNSVFGALVAQLMSPVGNASVDDGDVPKIYRRVEWGRGDVRSAVRQ